MGRRYFRLCTIYGNQNGVWTQIGQDIDGDAKYDESGSSVSLSSDGSIVAIGAPSTVNNPNFTGQVRIYVNKSGIWTQVGQDIDGEALVDLSGFSVSLSSDGCIVAIGALGNDGNGDISGHVRVYKLSDVKLSTEKIETDIYTYTQTQQKTNLLLN